MRWTEQPPQLPLQPLASLAGRESALAESENQAANEPGLHIAVAADARATALQHLAAHREECGGLLLGEVFADGDDPARSRAVLVTQAVAAAEYASTGISLRMSSAVWERARGRLGPLELVVGWYHSHPGLGAFFSATDRRTQRAFFPHAYSIGWVVDPSTGDSAWFVGREATPPRRVLYCVGGAGVAGRTGPESRKGGTPTTSTRSTK
jgi:proteasome lid subunit RPN8/RPN11